MPSRLTPKGMYASLREYLHELEDSGVDGVTAETADASSGQMQPAESLSGLAKDLPSGAEGLIKVRQDLGDCRRCGLAEERTKIVFGQGNPDARLVFVGEAPGADEDREGEPFVGAAGQVLTRLIEAMGFGRNQVYICNLIKCRPPGNRNPHVDEMAACAPFLLKQLSCVKPEVVVALGTFSAQTLLHSKEPISRMRGKFHDFHGIPLMPTFHPSFLLRSQHDKERYWEVWNDMVLVLKKLGLPVPEKKRK